MYLKNELEFIFDEDDIGGLDGLIGRSVNGKIVGWMTYKQYKKEAEKRNKLKRKKFGSKVILPRYVRSLIGKHDMSEEEHYRWLLDHV